MIQILDEAAAALVLLFLEPLPLRKDVVVILEHGPGLGKLHTVAVAALAGVPKEVIKRARQKLRELESISPNAAATQVDGTQMSLLSAPEETSPAVEALENLDPDSLTPRQALEWIYRLKSLV